MPTPHDQENDAKKIPIGFTLLRTLEGHKGLVFSVAVTPDGRTVISGSSDKTVRVWELDSGRPLRTLEGHKGSVYSVAVTPDGRTVISGSYDNTVRVWELDSGRALRALEGHQASVSSVAVTPDGRTVISGSSDNTVRVWELDSGRLLRTLEGHQASVTSVAVTPDGRTVISGSHDNTVRVWELDSGRPLRTLQGHEGAVCSMAATPDGRSVISTSYDKTVGVWDLPSGHLLRRLEGHSDYVVGLAISPDGKWIATDSRDGTVRLWQLSTGRCPAILAAPDPNGPSNVRVAFSPKGGLLATVGGGPRAESILLWQVDFDLLAGQRPKEEPVRYRNAKVVLVGDTGVGKSGLGMVLAGQLFQPTDSTHGRRVWLFETTKVALPGGQSQTREVLLWDLAGQPGYRLVHQLSIDQAALALVVIDARSETDPLGPAEYWARAIAQARSAAPITKFLVVARVDRGGIAVSPETLERFAQKFGFDRVFHTSAKLNQGTTELAEAIRQAIRWDDLEEVTSTQLFTAIKTFLQAEKDRGDAALVEKLETLFDRFVSSSGKAGRKRRPSVPNMADFRTCVGRLEAAGLIEVLRFRALEGEPGGDAESVLLQPEYIDAYASAAIMTARDEPMGIGHVLESDLLTGRLRLDPRERIPDPETERLVLTVTIERLLNHDIALRERLDAGDYLVFPSEYTRTAPYPRRNAPGVAFDFEGATRAVFTTLVVRLAHHRDFEKTDFYRDAACYHTKTRGRCAVVLDETAPGQGCMSVYFEDNPSQDEQQAFLRFVREHLEGKAKPDSVHVHRLYFCRACGHRWDETVIENRLKLAKSDIVCPNCDERSPLFDLLMLDTDQTRNEVVKMDADAEAARRRQLAATVIEGKKRIGEYDVFLSYHSADRPHVVELAEALNRLGLRPWLDVWDLVPGRPWQKALEEAIEHVKSAAVCLGKSGIGPWQDMEAAAFIRKFVKRESPVIPVLLPGAGKEPSLPTFLESFMWVDLRKFSPANVGPLASLVAGILGRRPIEMQPERLAEQVVAILAAPRTLPEPSGGGEEIVLPVNRPSLNEMELEAVRQQTARLLGISSSRLRLVGKRGGSVQVILEVRDLQAVSQLFAMVHRSDPALHEFFQRCQINHDEFRKANSAAEQEVKKAVAARETEADAADLPASLAAVPPKELQEWTGGAKVLTVAIVFTDIVDSVKLCNDLTEATWEPIRQQHFARAASLIRERRGIFVKNTGDGVLALFHDATRALDFALALHHDTGHAVVRIRAGVHIGQVTIDGGDTFGRHVNTAARVMAHAKADGVTVTTRVKEDVEHRGESAARNLRWTEFPNVTLKGFPEPTTLWRVETP